MKYRHLGKTGIQVSELSFGSWVTFSTQADVKAAVDMMAASTAYIYSMWRTFSIQILAAEVLG